MREKEKVTFEELGLGTLQHTLHGNPLPKFHRHNEVEINLVEDGAFVYEFGVGKVSVPQGRLSVFWAAMPHRITELQVPTSVSIAYVPLPWFLQLGLPGNLTQAVLQGHFCMAQDESRYTHDLLAFEEWHRLLTKRQTPGDLSRELAKIALLQIEARLRLLSLTLPVSKADQPAMELTDKISLMLKLIASNYTEELTLEQIAAAANLHPVYATTLFRKNTGMGIMAYLNQVRVTHAQRLLATTDDKIINIAMASGFGSATQFYTTFSRVCGCTPRQFRLGLTK